MQSVARVTNMVDHLMLDDAAHGLEPRSYGDGVRELKDAAHLYPVHNDFIGHVPHNRIVVTSTDEAGFNLGVPPWIFGRDRVKQPTVGGVQVGAKDATRGEQNTKGGQGSAHGGNIGA